VAVAQVINQPWDLSPEQLTPCQLSGAEPSISSTPPSHWSCNPCSLGIPLRTST